MIFIIFAAVSAVLALIDYRHRRVPNKILLPLFLILIVFSLITEEIIISRFTASVTAFAFMYLIRFLSRGNLGMGDCKYSAVAGFALGLYEWILSVVLASFAGVVITLILFLTGKIERKTRIPFVPFLWAGALAARVIAAYTSFL